MKKGNVILDIGNGNCVFNGREWVVTTNDAPVSDQGEGGVQPTPTPEPIAPLGKVQVFKDQSCTEYADGQSSIVYVRLNESFGYGDAYSWDNSAENDSLIIFTPDDENPQDDYLIQLWIDWNSQLPRTQGWQAGSVVELTNETSYRVNEPKVIFE